MPPPRWRRPLIFAALIVAALVVAAALVLGRGHLCGAPTTLLIVRHADRAGRDDALTPRGVTRAVALAHAMAKAELVAIYHSDTVRARDTAAPLAALLGATPKVRPAADVSSLVREVFAEHRGGRVLIVGHSNTVPQIIGAAGGPAVADIPENEFDNLFVLTVCGCTERRASLVRLRYGADAAAAL
jgi:broad specificity phosphatase PhoE